jgi:hypothetical protein
MKVCKFHDFLHCKVLREVNPEFHDFHYKTLRFVTAFLTVLSFSSIMVTFIYTVGPTVFESVQYFALDNHDVEWSLILKVE